jgi:hypothetical protein
MRSSIVAALVSVSVLACKTPAPHGPGGDDRGSAIANTAAPDAAPPPADTVQLYRQGKFSAKPTATATEYDGCVGTPDDLARCKRVDPAAACDLEAMPDPGSVYCRGAAMGPGDMGPPMPPSACACTCSAEYKQASGAALQRAQACSRVP